MRFALTTEPLALPADGLYPDAGGFVTFEGRVRDHAGGRTVAGLEYEAYPALALAQGEALLREAIERFGLSDARAAHRVGVLKVGETAVIVRAAAAHRRQAFEACEWVMDQLKWRVPIWKKETFADGSSEWVGAGQPAPVPEDERMFDRQARLPEVGAEGQRRIGRARVLLVGAGGLAAGCLPPLVGAGIGALGIVDPDTVDLTNLHRQTLFGASDVGRGKAELAAAFARKLRPGIQAHAFPEALTAANARTCVESYDWVVEGTDSLETKFLLNEVCRSLGKPLVTASVHQFEGHVMAVVPGGPCLRCLFPEAPPDHCVGTCAQSGVMGVVPHVLGGLQANEVVKGVLGLPGLGERLALVDLKSLEVRHVRRTVGKECPLCSGQAGSATCDWDLERLPEGPYDLVDIRGPEEAPILALDHRRVSLDQCYQEAWRRPTVFVCSTGRRSYRLAADLRAAGVDSVFSLRHGLQNRDVAHG
jgi:adenylyltransferase/sulfurtransferase